MVIPIFGIQAAPSILNLVQPDATLKQHVYLLVAMYTYSGTRGPGVPTPVLNLVCSKRLPVLLCIKRPG